jgi:hypothetical protein
MSERPALLSTSDAQDTVEKLAGKLKDVRETLGRITSELTRRTQDALKPIWRSLPPLPVVGLGGLTFLLVGSAVGLELRRRRKEISLLEKSRRLRQALLRIVEDPDRVAQPAQSLGRDVFGVVFGVAAATLAKKLIDRAF